MTVSASLDQGRAAFERQAWANAYQHLTAADREAALEPDLERLAIAAHLVGRDAESTDAWARAHHAFLARGAAPGGGAVRVLARLHRADPGRDGARRRLAGPGPAAAGRWPARLRGARVPAHAPGAPVHVGG